MTQMGVSPLASLVTVVTNLVIILSFCTAGLLAALLMMRATAVKRERADAWAMAEAEPHVMEIVGGTGRADEAVRRIASGSTRERRVARRKLLDYARLLRGPEARSIFEAYEKLGFADEDVRVLRQHRGTRKAEAAYNLGITRSARKADDIEDAMFDLDPLVAFSCMNALVRIGSPERIVAVMRRILEIDGLHRSLVFQLVMKERAAFAPLIRKELTGGRLSLKKLVLMIDLAGATKDLEAVGAVAGFLSDGNAVVRERAIAALSSIGDDLYAWRIRTLLGDSSARVRAEAAAAMGKLQLSDSTRELAALLKDSDTEVRIRAASALATLGRRGQEVLNEALAAEGYQRDAAAQALSARDAQPPRILS